MVFMKKSTRNYWQILFNVAIWALALVMLVGGFVAMFSPLTPLNGALGFIFSHRLTLVFFGVTFISAGVSLLVGHLTKNQKLLSHSLMFVFLCFTFAAILQGQAFAWAVGYWLSNALAAVVTAMLWLWWKFKTQYLNVRFFRRQAIKLDKYHKI